MCLKLKISLRKAASILQRSEVLSAYNAAAGRSYAAADYSRGIADTITLDFSTLFKKKSIKYIVHPKCDALAAEAPILTLLVKDRPLAQHFISFLLCSCETVLFISCVGLINCQ